MSVSGSGKAYVFIGDKQQTVQEWKHKLGTTDEQMEIFLLKYTDMDRDNLKYIIEVSKLYTEVLKSKLETSLSYSLIIDFFFFWYFQNLFDSSDDILSHPLNEAEIKTIADDIGVTLDDQSIEKFLMTLPVKQNLKTFFTEIACKFSRLLDISDINTSIVALWCVVRIYLHLDIYSI